MIELANVTKYSAISHLFLFFCCKSVYNLNSAVFFLVRKFYMLRCLFGALYVDMRCFGVSWVFSKHKIPHPNQWGSMKSHKEMMFIQ
mgnify:CR=1 FL=1